jgi:Asp-tRNA(Asn)/Glu-tRNA(Gln) amidotransferase A subunit family amidase
LLRKFNFLSAVDASRLITRRELTVEQLVRACIERINERNDDVRALVAFNEEKALQYSRLIGEQALRSKLHGIPFVAKDVLDTADFPTGYGSAIYDHNQPKTDSACVAQFKEKGAILIGKAATSEFATRKPAATRNPLRLTHTPGGSSSGPAAAVADFMVPFALGTQSTGSIVRPASYCGVVGFKPTYDLFNRAGLKPISQSQDTIGLFARTIADVYFITFDDADFEQKVKQQTTPRFAICRSSQWEHADTTFHEEIGMLERTLSDAGHQIGTVELGPDLEGLLDIQEKIFAYEAAAALTSERQSHGHLISDILQDRLSFGDRIDRDAYLACRSAAERAKATLDALFGENDVLIYPATESSAEFGIEYSGSPRFGALWSLLHLPTVVAPFSRTSNGMPFGLQLIGRFGCDRHLLIAAQYLMQYFRTDACSALQ